VYPQSCRRERFAARRRLAASRKICLSESERTIFGLDPAKSAAKPIRDREDGRIDSITIVPSDSLQQHLVAAKFASGTGFFAADRRVEFWNGIFLPAGDWRAKKGPEDDVLRADLPSGVYSHRLNAPRGSMFTHFTPADLVAISEYPKASDFT